MTWDERTIRDSMIQLRKEKYIESIYIHRSDQMEEIKLRCKVQNIPMKYTTVYERDGTLDYYIVRRITK